MKAIILVIGVVATAVAFGSQSKAAARQSPDTAFIHATIIDGTGSAPLTGMTLVVTDRRIASIAPDGTKAIPRGAHIEDLHGQYLIPGLIDSHVHLGTIERDADAQRAIL